jgi:hypothetical protein
LKCCREEGFDWVNLDTSAATALFDSPIEQVSESPLHTLGYRVGRSSDLSVGERRSFLKRCFSEVLPSYQKPAYVQRWGEPGTRRRLRRMSHALSWYIRGARGRQTELGHDMSAAIEDWERDLDWLRITFYEPWMRFRWPKTKVPG